MDLDALEKEDSVVLYVVTQPCYYTHLLGFVSTEMVLHY